MKNNRESISLVMIARDEAQRITACLASVRNLVDEMIVVDTGSTDKTKIVASELGAIVFDFKWEDDFSAARNFGLEKAQSDWILQLDADEELDSLALEIINKAITTLDSNVFGLQIIDLASSEAFHLPRLFRNKIFKYKGIIHENLVPASANAELDPFLNLPAKIRHYGYSGDVIKNRDKFNRNITLLKKAAKKDPTDMQTVFYLGATYQSAGQLEEAAKYYRQVIASSAKARFPNAFKNLVRTYESQNDLASAIKVAKEGVAFFPAYKAIWFHMGIAYYLTKNYSGAADSFQHCLTGSDDSSAPTSIPGIEILSKLFLALSEFEISKDPVIMKQLEVLMDSLALDSEALFYLGKTYINAYGKEKAKLELERIADMTNDKVLRIFRLLFSS